MHKSTLARSPLANFSVCFSSFSLSPSLSPSACLLAFALHLNNKQRQKRKNNLRMHFNYMRLSGHAYQAPTYVEMSLFNLMCLNQQKYAIKWESGQRRCRLKSVPVSPLKWARPSRTDRRTDRLTVHGETDSWTVCHFCAHSFKCRNKLTTHAVCKGRGTAEKVPHKAQTADPRYPQTTFRYDQVECVHFSDCQTNWPPGQMKCCPPLWVAASPTSICITDACIDSIKVFQLGTFPSPPLSRYSSFALYPH